MLLSSPGFSENRTEEPPSRLVVTVAEYRATLDPSPNQSTKELIASLLEGGEAPVSTIRLPTLSNCEAVFSSGARVKGPAVTTGGGSEEGRRESLQVGTILQLTAKRTSSTVLMQYNYTHSSLPLKELTGALPRLSEVTAQGTYEFTLGEPVLFSGLSGDGDVQLIITVTDPAMDE
tara:strand:- start:180021 stop:180548 length:528 start_codon:yes stop_codon:yes gene_type:complete